LKVSFLLIISADSAAQTIGKRFADNLSKAGWSWGVITNKDALGRDVVVVLAAWCIPPALFFAVVTFPNRAVYISLKVCKRADGHCDPNRDSDWRDF